MGEEVPGVVKQKPLQLIPTGPGTSDATLPQTGSQPVPQPGLSPVLAQYKSYLQSCYEARTLATADKYLPTLQAPYINLAMIKRGHHDRNIRDEFTRRTQHGGVDQILASKTPINIEDLLVPEECSKPVQFILVEGPPGIGKSTFAWELCRRWDDIESLRNYHTVVLLRLREKWVLNATKPSDLFRYPPDPELSAAIAKDLNETHGHNLLLVLDGFDEVSHSFHENSVTKNIFCRQLFPKCTIILTTRPSAKHILESVFQPPVDKHVEIIGFTDEERVRYITEVFRREPELQVNFLKYMFHVPHIKSMMYIPLNCAIIAQVYYESQQSSHHLAIPRTRTQLYKALTHCLLVRYMKSKESNYQYSCMLPEGLDKDGIKNFKILAKFAFYTYHNGDPQEPTHMLWISRQASTERKITFFKEDIPEELVHFGFMNECTEMYAGKGVEQTFSFLHLSLQEYLAAWHLAHSYSIAFQMAYHLLAVDHKDGYKACGTFLSCNTEEMILLSSLPRKSPEEPAVFLSGITGLKSQSEGGINQHTADYMLLLHSLYEAQNDNTVQHAVFLPGITGLKPQSEGDINHWEKYLLQYTAHTEDYKWLLHSLYEAQNDNIIQHYFTAGTYKRKQVFIGSDYNNPLSTPFDYYALSYCMAHSSDRFRLIFTITSDNEVSLLETLVKGLEDHCISNTPLVEFLWLVIDTSFDDISDKTIFWLLKTKFLSKIEKLIFTPRVLKSDLILAFLQSFVKLQSLTIEVRMTWRSSQEKHSNSLECLGALKSLSELRELKIFIEDECSPPPAGLECGPVSHTLREVDVEINLLSNTAYQLRSSTDRMVDSLLKSVLRSILITKVCLPNISRETMAGVHSILLHCPCLDTLKLKRTRLGYDGIIFICSALRKNTSLTHLLIHDDSQAPASRRRNNTSLTSPIIKRFISFSSMERVTLPDKTTCTDFLLELNHIFQHNSSLKIVDIQSGLFLPLSAPRHREYHQWTGVGPLQQFDVRAVDSGRSPNLRRSFSSSDLTHPQTLLFWKKEWDAFEQCYEDEIDLKKLLSKRKEEGKKAFSLPSFTAPDTEVLQSFSGLDPRLKQCLGISQFTDKYVQLLRDIRKKSHFRRAAYSQSSY